MQQRIIKCIDNTDVYIVPKLVNPWEMMRDLVPKVLLKKTGWKVTLCACA